MTEFCNVPVLYSLTIVYGPFVLTWGGMVKNACCKQGWTNRCERSFPKTSIRRAYTFVLFDKLLYHSVIHYKSRDVFDRGR
jgi:hypothetical protein